MANNFGFTGIYYYHKKNIRISSRNQHMQHLFTRMLIHVLN